LNPIHISCSDFVAEIGNLLDGDVDPQLRAHLEAHLASCRACTVVYDSTRKTIKILSDSATFELTSSELKAGTENVMARIRALRS
jgi:anti-sigma factor RsiW